MDLIPYNKTLQIFGINAISIWHFKFSIHALGIYMT